jgi:hypothetical protein
MQIQKKNQQCDKKMGSEIWIYIYIYSILVKKFN